MTYKILLPVDGLDHSIHAAHYIIELAKQIPALEVCIINVQPTADDWMIRRTIKPDELAQMEQQWSEDVMLPEHDILRAAGIPCQMQMIQGEVAPTVVQMAQKLSCQQIVMGIDARGSSLTDWLHGSVAMRVLHLSPLPVTFIK